jgi:S-(hydroxymethyl)glutathione dehydrogenase/alcohol dehydrogenase
MKGVLYDGDKAGVVSDLEVTGPGPGEVLLRVAAAGLCHSDVSVINGTIPFPTPVVLGHEGAGVVEAVGSEVGNVAPGDHVALSTLTNCGMCDDCDRGTPTMCRRTFGNRRQPFLRGSEPAYSFANTAVFAEYTVVKANQAVRIPDDVPLASAALLGCGVLTGVGAVRHRAKVAPGDTVAVIGVGGVGLNVVQGCRLANAGRIVAVDVNPDKEPLARAFGATDFLDVSGMAPADTVAAVKDLVRGGVDHAFECVGHPALIRTAIDLLGWGGTCVMLGVPAATAEVSFNVADMYLDKSILGCRYGSSRPQSDIPLYVELYRSGRLMLDELVTRTYPLDQFEAAIADMESGKLARGVLTLD